MSVTIQELQVDVVVEPAAAAPAPSGGRPSKVDLRAALQDLVERQRRLQAD